MQPQVKSQRMKQVSIIPDDLLLLTVDASISALLNHSSAISAEMYNEHVLWCSNREPYSNTLKVYCGSLAEW